MSEGNDVPERPAVFSRWFPARGQPARQPGEEADPATVPGEADPATVPGEAAAPAVEVEYEQRRAGTWRLPALSPRRRRLTALAVTLVILAGVAGGVLAYRASHPTTTVTAYFAQTVGVYPGSGVRVLGVTIGTVSATQPHGGGVKVTMALDGRVPIPASARAIVVTEGVVADRYVELSPAYTGGSRLASGAVIPVSRTAVPLEVDQIYLSLSKFFTALGPNGLNSRGALASLIKIGAADLRGNGRDLNTMLTQFTALNRVLGGTSADFFATAVNLRAFSAMLKSNNSQVALAEQQLASVTGFLASDRTNLAGALDQLATALAQVQAFIASNRGLIKANVDKLAAITSLLVDERASLAQALSTAPLALDNLLNAYDAAHKTLDGRGDLNELSLGSAAKAFGLLTTMPAGTVPVPAAALTALPPLPLPAVGTVYGTADVPASRR